MFDTYLTDRLRDQLERGTQPDEGFFRIKVTGNGETHWMNISPEQLAAIIKALEPRWETTVNWEDGDCETLGRFDTKEAADAAGEDWVAEQDEADRHLANYWVKEVEA
jgi:hypothetical protein